MKTFARTQNGFTIIEFMIAGTLGLVLLAGLMTMFLSSQQTTRSTRAQLELQNEGRFAMRFLTTQVQQAGWTGTGTYEPMSFPLMRVGDRVGPRSSTTFAVAANAIGEDVVAAASLGGFSLEASDRLVVQYVGATDCNGTADADGWVIDVFTVSTAGSTPALTCNGEPVVNNVESFQVLYQISSRPVSSGTAVADNRRWVNATNVPSSDSVRAVRVELLLASQDNAADAPLSRDFTLLDEAEINRNDRKLRQVFRSTIELANTTW